MSLDGFLMKLSRRKILKTYRSMKEQLSPIWGDQVYPERLIKVPVAQPLNLVKGQSSFSNEIGYWRKWYGLNRWMMELAKEKAPNLKKVLTKDVTLDPEATWLNGCPILLTTDDLYRLKVEVMFGDIWDKYCEVSGYDPRWKSAHTEHLINVLDRAMRIAKLNRSIVYYFGSW
jgi:hypothetical protein